MRALSRCLSLAKAPSSYENSIVIGFGEELKWIGSVLNDVPADLYVANIAKERFKDRSFVSFLSSRNRINFVANVSEEVVAFRHAIWLHRRISSVIIASFNPRANKQFLEQGLRRVSSGMGIVRSRASRRLDIYGHPVIYLPQDLGVEFTESLRNTGLIAIHLAASRSEVVHCIGFNFYSSQNFEGSLSTVYGEEAGALEEVSRILWFNFYRLIDKWKSKKFVLYVKELYKYMEKRSNLEVVILPANSCSG